MKQEPVEKLIKRYEQEEIDWSNPEDKARTKFKQELQQHIRHQFNPEQYYKARKKVISWVAPFFNLPQTTWSDYVQGTEKVKDLVNKKNTKLVIVPGPHTTHLDEFLIGTLTTILSFKILKSK